MESIKLKIGGEGGIKEPGLTSVVSLLVPHFADADELTDVTVEILNAVPGLTLGQKSTIVRMCKSSEAKGAIEAKGPADTTQETILAILQELQAKRKEKDEQAKELSAQKEELSAQKVELSGAKNVMGNIESNMAKSEALKTLSDNVHSIQRTAGLVPGVYAGTMLETINKSKTEVDEIFSRLGPLEEAAEGVKALKKHNEEQEQTIFSSKSEVRYRRTRIQPVTA